MLGYLDNTPHLSDLKNVFRELFKVVFRTQVVVFDDIVVNIVKNKGPTKTDLTRQVDCSSLPLSPFLSLWSCLDKLFQNVRFKN